MKFTKEQRHLSYINNKLAWKHFYPEGNGRVKRGYDLHHINPDWLTNDIDRYVQWNVEDLEMLTKAEHQLKHYWLNPEKYAKCGDANGMYGRHHTKEAKKKQGDACKGKFHFINIKTGERRMFKEAPNEDWVKGLYDIPEIKDIVEENKNKLWFINSITGKRAMFKEAPDDTWKQVTYHSQRRINKGKPLKIIRFYGENNGMYKRSAYENKSKEDLEDIKLKKQTTFHSKSIDEQETINLRRGRN